MKNSIRFEDYVVSEFKENPEAIESYAKVVFEEYAKNRDDKALLISLKLIAEAKGGITSLARKSSLNREHLQKLFAGKSSPKFNTLTSILNALGLSITCYDTHKHA